MKQGLRPRWEVGVPVKKRPCLNCNTSFKSHGNHNRFCKKCIKVLKKGYAI